MTAKIIQLPTAQPNKSPLCHAIRTGETSYRQLEHLHAEERLGAKTVIIDASRARFQKEFISSLSQEGVEIILDTKCAELSEIGKYAGAARGAPWAITDAPRPLAPLDFGREANTDLYGEIARFSVELGLHAVMAPSHFLRKGVHDDWWDLDLKAVQRLRDALDREGGAQIGIDFTLILPHVLLHDEAQRAKMIIDLESAPFDNLSVRLSGYGASAGPLTMKRTILALIDLQKVGKPILLDHIGGLVGLGGLALGAISGIGHGIGERERFDARSWHKPPKERDPDQPFGRQTFVPMPGFDRAFSKKDVEKIIASPKGRRLMSCSNRTCCPQGYQSMVGNIKGHIATEYLTSISGLESVPNARRSQHFLDVNMRNAERKARDISRLQIGDEKLNKRLQDGRKRIDSLARTFETLVSDLPNGTPDPIIRRINKNNESSRLA